MTIFEPAHNEVEEPDATLTVVKNCRFYVIEESEFEGREVVTGVDLDTFEFRSFFVDQMQKVEQM